MTAKTLIHIPEIPPTAGQISFNCDYEEDGKKGTTKTKTYQCWGFLHRELDEVQLSQLDHKASVATRLRYLLTETQYLTLKEYPEGLVQDWLDLLRSVGVEQWIDNPPHSLEELNERGVAISTNYPTPMMIGILETYRVLLYTPTYCAYVIRLWKDFGISPGASMILPKVLRIPHLELPYADAFTNTKGNTPYADLFSERHILRCIQNAKRKPFTENTNYRGVFLFFMSGYSNKIEELKGDPYILSRNWLIETMQRRRDSEENYGSTIEYELDLSERELHGIALHFNLTYERTHEALL